MRCITIKVDGWLNRIIEWFIPYDNRMARRWDGRGLR